MLRGKKETIQKWTKVTNCSSLVHMGKKLCSQSWEQHEVFSLLKALDANFFLTLTPHPENKIYVLRAVLTWR